LTARHVWCAGEQWRGARLSWLRPPRSIPL
jgi:hypothetical protein